MNKKIATILFCFLSVVGWSQEKKISIIPQPVEFNFHDGRFIVNASTTIFYQKGISGDLAKFLQEQLKVPTGFSFPLKEGGNGKTKNAIVLTLFSTPEKELKDAGYRVKVSRNNIVLSANESKGLFYALQSLLQLLPPAIASGSKAGNVEWSVPAIEIKDYPRFAWRGLMLDVSRHFFSKGFVKKYMDEMVRYKLNVLHLHLNDDQGWRIEIDGLPKLTEVGAWRVPRQGSWWSFYPPQPAETASYGGYYTQDDIKELVAYASKRYITILPEIDVPAHCLSLIAGYPEMSCTGKRYDVNPGSRFKGECNVLCVANPAVWNALDKIFTQVAELFPGNYIHVGGDEANRSFWMNHEPDKQLMQTEGIKDPAAYQSYFTRKLEKLILSKGKRMIGWDEILEGGLAPEATVMSWRGMEGGIRAAKMGHAVIMSPTTHAYLDLYQGDPIVEPETYSLLRLKSCYDFEPVPAGIDSTLILGGQGNLWTESVPNERHAEYMTWPRGFALAEVFWSPAASKDWKDFTRRMEIQFEYLKAANVNFATSAFDPIISGVKDANGDYRVRLSNEIPGLDLYYTFDGTNPDPFQKKYEGTALVIPKGASQIRARTYRDGQALGQQINFMLTALKDRVEPVK